MNKSCMGLLLALGAVSVITVSASESKNNHVEPKPITTQDKEVFILEQPEEISPQSAVPSTVSSHGSLNTQDPEENVADSFSHHTSFHDFSVEGNRADSRTLISESSFNSLEPGASTVKEENNKSYPPSDTLEPPVKFYEAHPVTIN